MKAGPRFIVLDQTAFYPESGGQPSDKGYIIHNGEKAIVLKVMKRGRDIFHYLNQNISVGEKIRGFIDWEPRLNNMKRHSAEHLLTGLFEEAGAGPKIYSDLEKLDFRPSQLTNEVVNKIELEFNRIVDENIPIRIYFSSREELDVGDDQRKKEFLKKIPQSIDQLRMVEILHYALTFCFGTHVNSTGEIGRLSELRLSKGKKGRKTVHFFLE